MLKSINLSALLSVVCLATWGHPVSVSGQEALPVDFSREIKPLLESACVNCHQADRAEGDLRLDTRAFALEGGGSGPALVPGDPEASLLYSTTVLPEDDVLVMPPETALLSPWQTERLKLWIEQGAPWPTEVRLATQPRIDFIKQVKPILEQNCLACHQESNPESDYDMSTQEMAFDSGTNPPAVVPFHAEQSTLYTLTKLPADDDLLMPPTSDGGPLEDKTTAVIELWIAQGANWPKDEKLQPAEKVVNKLPTSDDRELLKKIHARILATAKQEAKQGFVDYEAEVPQTGAPYEMVAIAGGQFQMGSPANELDRESDEGPQVEVSVNAFWMGRFEVTWDEYEPYMITQVDRYKWGARKDYDSEEHTLVDAVSQPTAPYTEMSFGMGQKGYPAISMTQHAANKYCQWLSAQTGHFYRLPTEAEWEYACRAGTVTAYSFGDDPAKLDKYAWYYDNANEKYQKVGRKEPNPWGLHDMHGNVMEWVADQYSPDYYEKIKASPINPLVRPTETYPRSVRGGSWFGDPKDLRSANRRGSDPVWKQQDPQLPKSIWYHTNAPWLGFRIVRPKKLPTLEELDFYWNSASEY